MDSMASLQKLKEGNERYIRGNLIHKDITAARLQSADEQQPFAVILGCSDSRVPPTLIFDQSPGDLFIIRVAGNILDDVVLGSIAYAVENLATKLVIVLGHERCGAVEAAVHALNKISLNEEAGQINTILKQLEPAVQKAKTAFFPQLWESACKSNVAMTVQTLQSKLKKREDKQTASELLVLGAYYNLSSGKVDFYET